MSESDNSSKFPEAGSSVSSGDEKPPDHQPSADFILALSKNGSRWKCRFPKPRRAKSEVNYSDRSCGEGLLVSNGDEELQEKKPLASEEPTACSSNAAAGKFKRASKPKRKQLKSSSLVSTKVEQFQDGQLLAFEVLASNSSYAAAEKFKSASEEEKNMNIRPKRRRGRGRARNMQRPVSQLLDPEMPNQSSSNTIPANPVLANESLDTSPWNTSEQSISERVKRRSRLKEYTRSMPETDASRKSRGKGTKSNLTTNAVNQPSNIAAESTSAPKIAKRRGRAIESANSTPKFVKQCGPPENIQQSRTKAKLDGPNKTSLSNSLSLMKISPADDIAVVDSPRTEVNSSLPKEDTLARDIHSSGPRKKTDMKFPQVGRNFGYAGSLNTYEVASTYYERTSTASAKVYDSSKSNDFQKFKMKYKKQEMINKKLAEQRTRWEKKRCDAWNRELSETEAERNG